MMAQLADLTTSEVSAATGFHRDNTGLQRTEESQNPISPQPLAQNRLPRSICPADLKHILSQIEPDRDNLRNDRSPLFIVADPPSHVDAVGGGHFIKAACRLHVVSDFLELITSPSAGTS